MTVDCAAALIHPFTGIDPTEVESVGPVRRGKVRDLVEVGDLLLLIATDRLSAFDEVLGTVPYRGQILTAVAAWWFEATRDLASSHFETIADPNVTVVRRCRPAPVEIVVRGYLSGSTSTALWTRYEAGRRQLYGHRLPEGMAKNDRLERPIVTPTTKAVAGHDEPVSEREVVDRGLVASRQWDEMRELALALFDRGSTLATGAGLVLVDTKYEMGFDDDGRVVVIDEIHTPDSSRFWRLDTLDERRSAGDEPDNLDKEIVRLAYRARGHVSGPLPPLDDELALVTTAAYAEVLERLTGTPLEPAPYPAQPRVEAAVRQWHRETQAP